MGHYPTHQIMEQPDPNRPGQQLLIGLQTFVHIYLLHSHQSLPV